jgi:hypothetical protein
MMMEALAAASFASATEGRTQRGYAHSRIHKQPLNREKTMRKRHWLFSSLLILCVTVALVSCENPSAGAAAETPSTPTPSDPTVAPLVGTWKTGIVPSSGNLVTSQLILTVSAEGDYVQEHIKTNTSSGSAAYLWSKGSVSISGEKLTMVQTATASGTASAPGTWTAEAATTTASTAALVEGKLYKICNECLVYRAQGSNSGIVGTWSNETYSSSSTSPKPYSKRVYGFASDNTFTLKMYESASSNYADPYGDYAGTYVLSGGSMVLTVNGVTRPLTNIAE